jgi:dienelactone hydrolase
VPPREARWASLLRGWGYATLLLDSFSERGLAEVCTTPSQLNQVQRVPDVYGALRVLATHPRIDPDRIFVMGWSHGGGVALEAATTWAARTFGAASGPRLRGAIAFYPACNITAPERREVGVPVRIHAGELDDGTLAAPCVRYVNALREGGADAEVTVHQGAQHAFDWPQQAGTLRTGLNLGACEISEASILGPVTVPRGCERRGWSFGYSPRATAAAEAAVREQLAALGR